VQIAISNKLFIIFALGLLLFIVLAPDAHATTAGGSGLPWESPLSALRQSLTGPVAFTISVIGVLATGAMLIFGGDLNGFMRSMVFLVLVIAVIVAANNIMASLFGVGAEITAMSHGMLWQG
jgi:type IV secretion system protein VirB2